jgi:hypothetical protein
MLMAILPGVGIWQSASFAYYEQEWARSWSARNPYRVNAVPPRHE